MSLSSGESLDTFLIFLFWSSTYYFLERLLRILFKRYWPHLDHHVRSRGKNGAFFGIAMGCMITTLTTPYCTSAYLHYSPSSPINFANPGAQEICLTGRGILWVQELTRLGDDNMFLAHHVGSLVSLFYVLRQQIPTKGLYAIYASLVTEIASDTAWLAGACGWTIERSFWVWSIELVTALSLPLIRGPGIVIAMGEALTMEATVFQKSTCGVFLTIYAGYMAYLFVRRMARLRIISINLEKPGYVRVGHVRLSMYGLCISLGLLPALGTSIFLYENFALGSGHHIELEGEELHMIGIGKLVLHCTIAGIIGSRLMAILCDHAFTKTPRTDLLWNIVFRRRFYMQGAVAGIGLTIWFSTDLPESIRVDLLAIVAIVLPLYEAVGRVGCHFAGCCHGLPMEEFREKFALVVGPQARWWWPPTVVYASTETTAVRNAPHLKERELFAVQLSFAGVYVLQTALSMTLLALGVTLRRVGAISTMLHAVIRAISEYCRGDNRATIAAPQIGKQRVSMSLLIAFAQVTAGVISLLSLQETNAVTHTGWTRTDGVLLGLGNTFADVDNSSGIALSVIILCICYGLDIVLPYQRAHEKKSAR